MADNDTKPDRLSVYLGAELIDRVKQAAAEAGAERGQPIPVSEWLREVIEEKLNQKRR